jgi:hypothetical protein
MQRRGHDHRAAKLRTCRAIAIPIGLISVGVASSIAGANPIDRAYEKVLSALRMPEAGGAVVMDQELPPSLLAAGLRPGDIIRRLDGRRILNLARWRKLLSSAPTAENAAKMQVVRGDHNLILTVGSQIAGLHLMMVRSGVAAPLGPIPESAHRLKYNWSFLRHTRGQISNPNTNRWFILHLDHYVVGALHIRVTRRIHGRLLDWNLISISNGPLLAQRWRIRFHIGDGHSAPAFTLVGLERQLISQTLRVTARGNKLLLYRSNTSLWTLHHAIPMPAVFLVADALQGNRGTTAAINEIGLSRLASRRGCTIQIGSTVDITIGGVGYRARIVRVRWLAKRQVLFYFAGHRLIAANLGHGLSAFRIASGIIARDIIGKRRWIEVLKRPAAVPDRGRP